MSKRAVLRSRSKEKVQRETYRETDKKTLLEEKVDYCIGILPCTSEMWHWGSFGRTDDDGSSRLGRRDQSPRLGMVIWLCADSSFISDWHGCRRPSWFTVGARCWASERLVGVRRTYCWPGRNIIRSRFVAVTEYMSETYINLRIGGRLYQSGFVEL